MNARLKTTHFSKYINFFAHNLLHDSIGLQFLTVSNYIFKHCYYTQHSQELSSTAASLVYYKALGRYLVVPRESASAKMQGH